MPSAFSSSTQDGPEPTTDRRRRWTTTVAAVVAALTVAPVAAWAGHTFTDVSSRHTFHADIQWMADNGVTRGCNPPANTRYCPDQPVTRAQMAAFLRRLDTSDVFTTPADVATAIARSDVAAPSTGTIFAHVERSEFVTITSQDFTTLSGSSLEVTVPPGTTADVLLEFASESSCWTNSPSGIAACELQFRRAGSSSPSRVKWFDTAVANGPRDDYASHATSQVVADLGPGTHTFEVQLRVLGAGSSRIFEVDDWTFTATVHTS